MKEVFQAGDVYCPSNITLGFSVIFFHKKRFSSG